MRELEMFATVRHGLFQNREGIEIRVPTPGSIAPFRRLRPQTVGAYLNAEIVERIVARRLCLLVLAGDAIDVNSDHPIAAFDAFHNFVPYPSASPGAG